MCNLKVSCCLLLLFAGYSNTQNCPATDNENVLQPGYDYIYRFESKVVAEAVGTTDDKSEISISCDVLISHVSSCLYTFTLDKCSTKAVGGPPGSESAWIEDQPLSDLSKYPVLFSLSNGEITEIQVDENDPIHFVNIKRGALSAFVFKLSYTTQPSKEMHTDVHGTCPWSSYPLLGSKGSVKAEKDMLHCSFPSRKDWQFSPYSLFWNMSFIQYVINSTTSCNYDININEKILNKVYCKERHAIMLESSSKTDVAVQSNIQYRMNFVSSSPQTEKKDLPDLSRKTDISYEFERTPNPDENPEDFLPVAKKMLSDLVEQSMDEISLSTIPQFTNFVAWIRSAKDLSSFLEEVKSCSFLTTACTPHMKDLGMSYLKDALIQCNSLPCIQAVSHLVESKDISGEYLNYFSWSNMHFSKPEILKFIMNICHATDSDVCWASLGSLFRRIYSSNQKLIEDSNIMHDVAKYFHDNIGRLCMSNDSNSETYPLLLRYLKTVRNMGRSYLLLIPQGIWRLTECVLKSDVPEYVRTFALETLQAVNPCHYEGHCETIYYQRMHILRNASESTTLRSLAYEHIIQIPQKYGFEDDILEILKTDENLQLKSYIANSLKSLLKDSYFRKKEEKFVKSMNQLLNDNELSLNKIIHYPGAKSASHVNSQYFSLSFLPDGLKEFGFKTINSNIYESSDVLPRYFNKELTIKAFSKLMDVFQLGGYSEGLEKVAIVFQKLVKDFNPDIPSFKKILNALQEALKEFKPTQEDSSQEYNFHESIIENIRKLEQIYRKFKPNPESFFTVFSDLFGTTAGYFSAKETIPSLSKLLEMHTLMNDLERGVTYNTTRVIRFIEAYHQVPTMMGLPLNWTSNATLAFSLRSGFNLKWDANGVKSGGFCHPSAALTFLNRMVIDFPTITQIGVQANSSGYTSTQWKANLEYSKDKKIFSFVKPTKTQKVLELFRTNQLIKHDRYQDIEDWDLERTSSSSCTNDEWSSALGLRACLSKSYPNVTRRLKPWALLSGWCKWQFFINSFDEKLESYDLEKIESTEAKSKDLIIKFSTSGSEDKREIFVKFEADDTKGERKALVEMPSYPDFIISYLQKKPLENSKERKRYTEVLILKLRKDHEYQLIYNEEDRLDNRLGNVAADESPTDKKSAALVHEQVLSLDTPYNSYRLSKEDSKNEEDTKMKVFFSYDNRNPSKKWLDTILPPSFWETEGKAWLLFQINWKEPKVFTDTTTRQTVCFVKDPHAIIYLDANSFEMTGREQTNINLTKTEINTGKLLGFANFTYDFWMSRNDEHKVTRDFNLTVGPKSWTVQMQNVIVGNKLAFEVTMKRSIIQTKSNEVLDYEDLWNKDTRSAFKEEKRQIKFIFDAEFVPMSSEELTDKYSKVKMDDIGGLSNYLVTGAFKFYYPFDNGEESVILDGYAIFSSGSTTFRFQKNIVLENSYSNLRITSDTVYSSIDDLYSLMHKTSLMYVPTEAEAILFIKGWLSTTCDKCMEGELVHNFNSKFFDYQSNVSYKCISDRKDMHILLLHFVQNSSAWNMLNYEIDQIVEDISPEYKYETTNFTHPALIINVTADWTRKIGDHKKRVLFTCTEENCQSTELLLEFLHDGKVSMKLIMPNDQNRIFLIEKTVSSNAKNLNIRINYSDDLEDESKDLQLKAEILSTDYHIWNLKLNLDTFYRVKHLFGNAYQKVLRNLLSITKDPQHPVNVMLEPTLKMPVYDYVQNVRIEVDDFIYTTWEGFKETLIILKPFYIAPLTIMKNTATNAETIARKICKELEERSVLIWAINYFDLPSHIYETVVHLPENMPQIIESNERIYQWEFVTGKILQLYSFRSLPDISLDGIFLNPFSKKDNKIQRYYRPSDSNKIAILFGPHHVYTFDGHLYDSAEYSSDCTFLLGHDLRKSAFTVLSDKNAIHVLFPEMAISVNGENEVFINGSTTSSNLPIESNNGKIVVRRSDVVEIWSPSLKVICSSRDFLCVLELDSWHNGETFGLLGNADGSSSNEFMLPDGKPTSNVLNFVTDYEVSGNSECQNLHLPIKSPHSYEAEETCSSHFRNLCQFNKNTFEAFLDVCKSNFKESDACYATTGYASLCYFKNLPSITDCNVKKQVNRRIEKKLEVVLIINEHRLMAGTEKSLFYKGMERMFTALNDKFKTNGYSSVLFSVVGFGGKGARYQPTVYAKGRDSWMPLKALLDDVLESLQFDGKEDADILKILKFSLDVMGYDSFNSKIFIVLTTKDRQSKNKQVISTLQHNLEKNGITLYTFSSYPSIEKGMKVYGVRGDGLMFPSPKKGEDAYLDYPRGDLAKLTSATRGSLFLSKFIQANKPAAFFREVANEVWSKINKESQICRECSTVRSNWWWQVNECNIVHC